MRIRHCAAFAGRANDWVMSMNPKSIVITYCPQDETFRRETLREHVQGNAIRLLKDHAVVHHAIAVADTPEDADKAVANFTKMRRIAQGLEEPGPARGLNGSVPALAGKAAKRFDLLRLNANFLQGPALATCVVHEVGGNRRSSFDRSGT